MSDAAFIDAALNAHVAVPARIGGRSPLYCRVVGDVNRDDENEDRRFMALTTDRALTTPSSWNPLRQYAPQNEVRLAVSNSWWRA